MDVHVSEVVPHPTSPPIYNEVMWIAIFGMCLLVLAWRHRGRRELSNSALMFIGASSMFWQEYFNNWGGYLLYSPDLHLWPWGSSWWTAPNKPIFLMFSYGPYFMLVFTGLVWLNRWLHARLPGVPLLLIALVVNGPLFWVWNFAIDAGSVQSGIWNYMLAIGPVHIVPNGGFEPLVWPMLPFSIYAALVGYGLSRLDAAGHPTFLRFGRPERYPAGAKREGVRVLTSIVWWNAGYWFGFTLWVNLVRELFLPASAMVP